MSSAPRVAMRGIVKTFGPVTVLQGVDLEIAPGEIHGLVGQNGAGKSTLMKVLGGVYPDHRGEVRVDGDVVTLSSPRAALGAGIGVIYQELSLIPTMTVAENIMLGIEPGRGGYREKSVVAAARRVIERTPLLAALPLGRLVSEVGAGTRQMIEIAKALARDARILVLDEPTARLSGPEREGLHALVRELAASGTSAIYISHFLEDVLDITDRITVMRNGEVVASDATASFDHSGLVRALLSRELMEDELGSVSPGAPDADVVLEAQSLTLDGRFTDISFQLRRGEILGIAGLVGSGRSRLARAVAGAEATTAGRILLDGAVTRLANPREASRRGVVLVPEDRGAEGIIASASAGDNLILRALDRDLTRGGWVRRRRTQTTIREEFGRLDVRPSNPELAGVNFSGGNQQKLLLGRALLAKPRVLIADQPTAGVDIGAKAQIHRLIRDAAAEGASVIVITDDLDELLGLADTVSVMKKGRFVSTWSRPELDHERLVELVAS